MAQKKSQASTKTNVRRITAKDDSAKKPAVKKAAAEKITKTSTKKTAPREKKVGYFQGAWQELKQVRWPTRSTTWSMTAAVLAFTALMAVIILLLDAGFNWLSQQVLK